MSRRPAELVLLGDGPDVVLTPAPAPAAATAGSTGWIIAIALLAAVAITGLVLGIYATYWVLHPAAATPTPTSDSAAAAWVTTTTLADVALGATGVVRVVVSAQGPVRVVSINGPVAITNTDPIGLPTGTFATADLPWVNTDTNPVSVHKCFLSARDSPLSSIEWMFVFLDGRSGLLSARQNKTGLTLGASALFYTGAAAQFTEFPEPTIALLVANPDPCDETDPWFVGQTWALECRVTWQTQAAVLGGASVAGAATRKVGGAAMSKSAAVAWWKTPRARGNGTISVSC
jgi:hypothetical protein